MVYVGKQRARRIDRKYYHAIDPYVRWKRLAGMIAFGLGCIYAGCLVFGWNAQHVSTGQLSHAHTSWNEQNCEVCHESNKPIRSDAWGGRLENNVHLFNQKCNSCHPATGHFVTTTDPAVTASESCASCHREHQGSDASLVDLADTDCTRCHQEIATFLAKNATSQAKNVDGFSEKSPNPHPQFKSLSGSDPGTIKFSHVQHLRPGQPAKPRDGSEKKFAQIPESFRIRYAHGAAFELDQLIQLRCSDCHETDVDVPNWDQLASLEAYERGLPIPTNSHRLFKAVNFEKHCQACHDLDGVPHGLDREATQAAVAKLVPVRQLEFLRQRNQPIDANLNESALRDRELRLQQLMSDESSCFKCHEKNQAPNSSAIVAPSKIPTRWFPFAEFPHGEHLMVACKDCHPAAYTTNEQRVDSVKEADSVMIRNIESCRECHIQDEDQRRRAAVHDRKPVATADCVDCHRYHVDPPLSPKTEVAPAKVSATRSPSADDFSYVKSVISSRRATDLEFSGLLRHPLEQNRGRP